MRVSGSTTIPITNEQIAPGKSISPKMALDDFTLWPNANHSDNFMRRDHYHDSSRYSTAH